MARDRCRTEYVNGEAVSVLGPAPLDDEDRAALAEVVRAAHRHLAANPPPEVSPRVMALADRIERGDILTISRSGLKAAVMAELKRRHPESTGDES